ncbi:MAG: hypothetical protein KBC11_02675, partial [Candidatus Pacebacteria bacterium]|nr:hypothetical protein [Candidatus Paceibacterota bacterium]
MTIHIRIPEYDCKNCETPFIVYSKGLGCPKCGQVEESNGEGYGFIDSQANALLVHQNVYGRFTPHAWHSGSYCDN